MEEKAKKAVLSAENCFSVLDNLLEKRQWLVDDDMPTLADLVAASEVRCSRVQGCDSGRVMRLLKHCRYCSSP